VSVFVSEVEVHMFWEGESSLAIPMWFFLCPCWRGAGWDRRSLSQRRQLCSHSVPLMLTVPLCLTVQLS